MQVANRVILNSGITYIRMLITSGITLYTTRLVLDALGVVDFGIYNLVAGVIAMLAFLNTAMSVSTQRYLSFQQGKNDLPMQKKIFANSLFLHIIIGVVLVVVIQILGLVLFDGFFNIPEDKINIAKAVYQLMSITIFFSIISVPFVASLNAHENMLWIAIVNVIDVFLKLLIALLITYVIVNDKLIVYAALTAVVGVFSLVLYMYYCLKKYQECSLLIKEYLNKKMLFELGNFASWNLFGAACGLGRTQGLAILLNIFFGTIINAAYAISNQINAQLSFFSATMLRVLSPQIMKSEGSNDRKRMLRLSMMASKFSYFSLAFVAIPAIFEMPTILNIWLKNVPENTVIFCQLTLICTLCLQFTVGLQLAAQACGEIKYYQSVVGSILLFNLPIGYFALKMGYPAYFVIIGSIFVELIAGVFRLIFLKKLAGMSLKIYYLRVFKKEIIPTFSIIISCLLITKSITIDYRFILTTLVSSLLFFITIYQFGLCKDEKETINKLLLPLLLRKKKHA